MPITDAQYYRAVHDLLVNIAADDDDATQGIVRRAVRFTKRPGTAQKKAERREAAMRLLKELALASGLVDNAHARKHWLAQYMADGRDVVEIP